MLNTYIKNRGLTQTIIRKNNKNQFNEINWNADYNGNMANISLVSNTNGEKQYYDIRLDNNDLASMLNIPSVNLPIDKRLKMDLDITPLMIPPRKRNYYLSSPHSNEEFIAMKRNHTRHKKTHKTYKMYKKKRNHKTKSKRYT